MPESVLSRLARSTELSKTESRSAGAARIQSRRTRYKSESDCPRNLTNIPCCAKPCQRERPTAFPPDFHNWNSGRRTGERNLFGCRLSLFGFRGFGLVQSAQRYGLPLSQIIDFKASLGHAKAEDRKLRKELTFGGPCFEGTLQKPTGVSESSPVAGTT